jgi:amino acid adenylation domain-containing protein
MIVAMYGVLRAGAAYVPLATETPRERLAFMLRSADVAVVLTHERLLPELASTGVPALTVAAAIEASGAGASLRPAAPDNAAYVIHTSGSTGEPKGVVVTHRSLCNLWAYLQDRYRLTAADRLLHHLPFTFDMAAFGHMWPLVAGATVVVAAPGLGGDPAHLVEMIREAGVTGVVLAPAMLELILDRPGLEECRSLRFVVTGGDTLPARLQERFLARMGAQLHNAYGPTETTIGMTFRPCVAAPWEGSVPIGRPMWNTRTYVLDRHLRPVPVGVRGELYIGGLPVARGYAGRADLTAERFLPDPHDEAPGRRMYRSGDLARYLPDGELQCLGRADDQVKLRGIRIEPLEIQARLDRHPAVRESFVCLREDTLDGVRLVAYVVPREGAEPRWADVRAFLADWLPGHMIPSALVTLESLPLKPSGKVDRAALPPPGLERAAAPAGRQRTRLEQVVAGAWQSALQVAEVGLQDNFFDLGGHSLLMVSVADRLRAEVSPSLTLLDLFQHPTVESLAAHLAGLRRDAGAAAPDLVRGRQSGQLRRQALDGIAARRARRGR